MPYSTRNTVLVRWALKQWKIPLNWHLLLIINCIYVELGDGSIINYWSFCSLTCDVLSNSDLVLSNKLVVYDVQNQTIGWTDFNCEYFMLFAVFSFFPFFFSNLLLLCYCRVSWNWLGQPVLVILFSRWYVLRTYNFYIISFIVFFWN